MGAKSILIKNIQTCQKKFYYSRINFVFCTSGTNHTLNHLKPSLMMCCHKLCSTCPYTS